MSKKETGGPAFPIPLNPGETYTAGTQGPADGMTLRDHFAGQALIGMLANQHAFVASDESMFARDAYVIADAMLKERAK